MEIAGKARRRKWIASAPSALTSPVGFGDDADAGRSDIAAAAVDPLDRGDQHHAEPLGRGEAHAFDEGGRPLGVDQHVGRGVGGGVVVADLQLAVGQAIEVIGGIARRRLDPAGRRAEPVGKVAIGTGFLLALARLGNVLGGGGLAVDADQRPALGGGAAGVVAFDDRAPGLPGRLDDDRLLEGEGGGARRLHAREQPRLQLVGVGRRGEQDGRRGGRDQQMAHGCRSPGRRRGDRPAMAASVRFTPLAVRPEPVEGRVATRAARRWTPARRQAQGERGDGATDWLVAAPLSAYAARR
ncbi:hypothetical protein WR25_10152 [Diploscapter pachys]|uniref:Uncharacterized protein n=1 Tax=Diploscapter pachys TaxID=2018661 RepID=A0A2A2M3C3_9BILA|nr:hypothetical protein WR25_10152 [Diploscapter pachys]